MQYIWLVLLLILPLNSWSKEYKHMVSFGSHGLGWSGAYEEMDTRDGSPFNGVEYSLNDLSLNYAYRWSKYWQVGAFYQNGHEEYRFRQSGSNGFAKLDVSIYGLFTYYNFSRDIDNSFYLGPSVSYFTVADEVSHNLETEEGKAPFELDDGGYTFELIFGKRFSFSKWDIEHLTFSPQISLYHRQHGRDFDDQEVSPGLGIAFQLIKFDFLF